MGWLWWADRATTTPLGRHICNRCEATGDSALFINGCCDGLGLHPAQRVAKASCCRGAKMTPRWHTLIFWARVKRMVPFWTAQLVYDWYIIGMNGSSFLQGWSQNCWPISTCFKSTEAVEFGAPTRSDLTGWKQEVSTGSREVWDSVHQWLWGPTYPEPLLSPPEIDDHWKGSPSFTGCRYGLQYYTW